MIPAILIGVAIGTHVVPSIPMGTDAIPPAMVMPCTSLGIFDYTPQDKVDDLLGRGWRGDPSDGAERLYSPECGY